MVSNLFPLKGFGVFSWFGYRPAIDERVRMIKAAGYAATSVWLGRQEPLVREGKADIIPDIVRSSGLFFEYVHASYANVNKLWSRDPAERALIREDYAEAIRFCARHRIPTVVMHIVKGMNPPAPSASGLAVIADLVKLAEDGGVRIAVENTRHTGYADYVLERIESSNLGFCYDSSHDFLYGEHPGEVLRSWSKRLMITHLSDNDGLSDKHWLPGLGNGNWEPVADSFPAEEFDGYLTLEVLPKRESYGPPEQFLRAGIERLDWFWSIVEAKRNGRPGLAKLVPASAGEAGSHLPG